MAINTIRYNGETYNDGRIEQATGFQQSTLVGDTLPFSTLEADVWDFRRRLDLLAAPSPQQLVVDNSGSLLIARLNDADMTAYAYASPVQWTHRNKLLMNQFLTDCKRIGKYKYRLSCVSGIGLIAQSPHYGGLYQGETTFGALLADIIGGAFPYAVDADISAIRVFGWLPVATRRANLRQLLTAYGVVVRTNSAGNPWFTTPATNTPISIADSRIEINGSVEYPTPYQTVKVTEHAFTAMPTDTVKTLFEGQAAGEPIVTPKGKSVTGVLVTFEAPMHNLSVANSEILESDVNYAVLASSPSCILTGQTYNHTRRVITRGSQSATESATKRLEDCTLVNLMNSESVAERWYQFFASRRTAKISAVWNGEQPSDAVTFSDPYDDPITGIITKLDVRLSNTLMADMEVAAGTIPNIVGNYYSNLAVITTSGTFIVPAECKGKIRIVLIGGGAGGECGEAGAAGERGTHSSNGAGGVGGQPGAGGTPGKIFVGTLEAKAGQAFAVVIGAGGLGAEFGSTPGAGGATTFGAYSSADGFNADNGYVALLDGKTYALPGDVGVAGSDGIGAENWDAQTSVSYGGSTWYSGAMGEGLTVSSTGTNAGPGFGGGAAVGAHGTDGGDASEYSLTAGTYAVGGRGGDGATPIAAPNATVRGSGGPGGHGGGGGGGGGGSTWSSVFGLGNGGPGGNGGRGGDGAPGIILIYY